MTMWWGLEWWVWVIGIEGSVILALLPHALWPNHKNPFAWKEEKKPNK
jgi:hypothetical protein